MDNTFLLSSTTRLCRNLMQCRGRNNTGQSGAAGTAFADCMKENISRRYVQDMTLEEYKQHIYDRISRLPMDSSNRMDMVSVQISDEGFAAMKNDPEYEQWVLDSLEANFLYHDPWSSMCGGKYVMLRFGATKEECSGESWRMGNGTEKWNPLGEEEKGFWERRAEKREQLEELREETEEKSIAAAKQIHRTYTQRLMASGTESDRLRAAGSSWQMFQPSALLDVAMLLQMQPEDGKE